MITEIKRNKVDIRLERVVLKGILSIPQAPVGLVLFSHGSGSSRLSTRNNFVAEVLQKEGIATLLFDLLTEAEDRDYAMRFDIPLLTERLVEVTHWCEEGEATKNMKIAYFGASTGAASALGAAAYFGDSISSVVSRGGRPDLALAIMEKVLAPTLFLVGERDHMVIGLNRQAFDRLSAEKQLEIIPGASHLFEEPGTLEEVARLSALWFNTYFKQP